MTALKLRLLTACLLAWVLAACGTITGTPALLPTTTPAALTVSPGPAVEIVATIAPDRDRPNPLDYPSDVALDAQGNLYVVDSHNERIQKFDATGRFLMMWGSPGAGPGQFAFTAAADLGQGWGALDLDAAGHLYVADRYNCRVQKFDGAGKFLAQWGRCGRGAGEFVRAVGIAVSAQGRAYVTGDDLDNVQVFDLNGKYLFTFGGDGQADGRFEDPGMIAVEKHGLVYVADVGNARVEVFDADGKFLKSWAACGAGRLYAPAGIALDGPGNIYVSDRSGRLCKYDHDGQPLADWSQPQGLFLREPAGLWVDSHGYIYLADSGHNRVLKLRLP